MRTRLFTQMLIAFLLVIVLGVGGMALMFGLAFVGARNEDRGPPWENPAVRIVSHELYDYYAERGSWEGIASQIEAGKLNERAGERLELTLLDGQGRLVGSSVSNERTRPAAGHGGPLFGPAELERRRNRDDMDGMMESFRSYTIPIENNGRTVGTLFASPMSSPSEDEMLRRFVLGVTGAGLGLATVLLAFAFFFSRGISRPLQQLNAAAQRMASGDMSTRVATRSAREIDTLAQSFNRMADSLLEADRQRRQVTADIAHELRTPLSVVKGRLEGIQDGVYQADGETIAALLDSTALLERLIEDLRLLALAEAGQLPLYREPVDPRRMVEDAARSFAQQAEERGVTLDVQATNDVADITVDPQRISQVLGNLLSNALQHSPAGGHITLTLTDEAERVSFHVSDNGTGIAAEDLPQIFERFWRADRARSRASGGAGLGLAIARQIVEAHGGGISAESRAGAGTTIVFWIPREED